jgi:hypothetical protein
MFTHSISAKPQQRPENRQLSPLLTNFGKKWLLLHRRRCKILFFIFFGFDFLHIDPGNDFCFCKFLPKVSKVKERGSKLNFGLRKW